MSFIYMNVETIGKWEKKLKSEKFKSPGNEFLLHKYRKKNEKLNFFSSNLKTFTSTANEFLYSEKMY